MREGAGEAGSVPGTAAAGAQRESRSRGRSRVQSGRGRPACLIRASAVWDFVFTRPLSTHCQVRARGARPQLRTLLEAGQFVRRFWSLRISHLPGRGLSEEGDVWPGRGLKLEPQSMCAKQGGWPVAASSRQGRGAADWPPGQDPPRAAANLEYVAAARCEGRQLWAPLVARARAREDAVSYSMGQDLLSPGQSPEAHQPCHI